MFNTLLSGAKAVKRFAGSKPVLDAIRPAFANEAGKFTVGSVAGRVVPDLIIGGGLTAMHAQGDAVDKGLQIGSSVLGGTLGGAAVSALTRGKLGMMGELVGGVGGDMLAQQASIKAMQAKDAMFGTGQGLDPYQRMGEEERQRMIKELENQFLAKQGLLPGARAQYMVDPSTGMGVS